MHTRSLLIAVPVLIVASACVSARAQTQVDIPYGASVTIDGTIESKEWTDAARLEMKGGGTVLLKHDGEFLYAGVRGTTKGWSHLYLSRNNGSTVEVLHASAALGSIIYTRDGPGKWQTSGAYSWELRGGELNEAKKKAFDDYLSRNGWVASNSNMGTPAEHEFKVKLDASDIRIAVVHAFDTKDFTFFPVGLADDTLKSELVVGNAPPNLIFDVRQWTRIKLKAEKGKEKDK